MATKTELIQALTDAGLPEHIQVGFLRFGLRDRAADELVAAVRAKGREAVAAHMARALELADQIVKGT